MDNIRNKEIAQLLDNIADLLELKEESPYRIGAYRQAARRIESTAEDIAKLRNEGRLREIPGVGESIATKIDEYLRTGRLQYYEELKQQVAPGLTQLLQVPGLGPRRAEVINRELGITTVAELEEAARQHKLDKLPGIREKSEQKILREIERLQERSQRLLLGVALPAAEEVVALLMDNPAVKRIDPAGSIRRRQETIGDIDILVASDAPEEVMDAFTTLPIVKEVLLRGPTKSSVLTDANLQIDLRVIKPEEYGSALQYFTGSKPHNIELRDLAIRKGMKLSEYGLFDVKTGRRLAGRTEEEVYRGLGMEVMPPEIRQASGEIEAAIERRLPKLIEEKDLKGDLHVHTNWSDGADSLEQIVEAAREKGYEYVAISDHSVGLGIAGGLTPDEIREQRQIIRELNEKHAPFRILHGIELDIRSNGTLDYEDEILREFDIVSASIHSGFGQSREKMTERIIRAIRNPYVDVLNHPTGRLIGKRPGYDVDLEAVIRAAAEEGVALEINSQPDRLDLGDIWARRAKELGAMLVIDSDAHSRHQLYFVRYGIYVARRGWIEKKNVLNALPLDELLACLHRSRSLVAAGRSR